jgi:hypothetical protein
MPSRVECGVVTCRHNEPFSREYGYCKYPEGIVLKWRLSADMGKGFIVMTECLQLEIAPMEVKDEQKNSS